MLVEAFDKYNNQEKTDSIVTNTDELLKYAELYEKGLLTKEEFENKKGISIKLLLMYHGNSS